MNFKHWIVVGGTALALVACGTPAASNTTPEPTSASTADVSDGTSATSTGDTTAATSAAGNTTTTSTANSGDTVARLDNIILTRGELDERTARILEGITASGGEAQLPSNQEIEQSLVELFLNQTLTLSVANARGVGVTEEEIDTELAGITENITAQGGTLEQAITGQLGYADATSSGFRQLIASIVARQKIGATLVTTDTVEQELRADLEEQAKEEVKKADVRHILVATEEEANQAIERLNAGETFEDLAKELSTDPGSKDNGGLYEGIEPGQFVPEFDQAMFEDLQEGETTAAPVKTQFGYHIIRLEKLTTGPRYTAEQIEEQLTEQVPFALQQRRDEEFQKLVDAERETAKSEGRLEEPTYVEPTPVVPGELPSDVAPAETPTAVQ